MPSATPLPRGPSVLILGSAEQLLAGTGCPVCPHAAEAGDRYLAWFALEGHSDAGMVTRLAASLGMCPRHTRRIMSQPGASSRLTALYRYVIRAADRQLGARRVRLARCPACEHEESVAGRLTGLVFDGLQSAVFRLRYQEQGSLCLPHLRVAAGHGRRDDLSWLMPRADAWDQTGQAFVAQLAGGPDPDADARAALRAALPRGPEPPAGVCQVCLAAARAERDQLSRMTSGRRDQVPRGTWLCAAHLADATRGGATGHVALLSRQAGLLAGALAQRRPLTRRGLIRALAAECSVCRGRKEAASAEIRLGWASSRPGASGARPVFEPCVRHVLELRAVDSRLAWAAAVTAAQRAAALLRELDEAARKGTWGRRQDPRGGEMTAWRRAPVFLDGGVTGGCPADLL